MKYKLVAAFDILLGGIGLAQQLLVLLFVYPKMGALYGSLGVNLPFLTKIYPYISIFVSLILIFIIYVGLRLVVDRKNEKLLFKLGLVGIFLIVVFGGYYLSSLIVSIIGPIYNLSSGL